MTQFVLQHTLGLELSKASWKIIECGASQESRSWIIS